METTSLESLSPSDVVEGPWSIHLDANRPFSTPSSSFSSSSSTTTSSSSSSMTQTSTARKTKDVVLPSAAHSSKLIQDNMAEFKNSANKLLDEFNPQRSHPRFSLLSPGPPHFQNILTDIDSSALSKLDEEDVVVDVENNLTPLDPSSNNTVSTSSSASSSSTIDMSLLKFSEAAAVTTTMTSPSLPSSSSSDLSNFLNAKYSTTDCTSDLGGLLNKYTDFSILTKSPPPPPPSAILNTGPKYPTINASSSSISQTNNGVSDFAVLNNSKFATIPLLSTSTSSTVASPDLLNKFPAQQQQQQQQPSYFTIPVASTVGLTILSEPKSLYTYSCLPSSSSSSSSSDFTRFTAIPMVSTSLDIRCIPAETSSSLAEEIENPPSLRLLPNMIGSSRPATNTTMMTTTTTTMSTPPPPPPPPLPHIRLMPKPSSQPPATLTTTPTVLHLLTKNDSIRVKKNLESKAEPTTLILKQQPQQQQQKRVESVACFKCTSCGFLGLNFQDVEEHTRVEHDLDDDDLDLNRKNSWLHSAIEHGIPLKCPFCPNTFQNEGSRSFKVHVTDDHNRTEDEVDKLFQISENERKEVTLALVAKKRVEEKEMRRKRKKETLEAYVNENGDLRVRTVKRDKLKNGINSQQFPDSSDDYVDVGADEYLDALDAAKKAVRSDNHILSERQKFLANLPRRRPKATTVVDEDFEIDVDDEDVDVDVDEEEDDEEIQVDVMEASKVDNKVIRKRVGRPRGSKSLGLTKLKKLNPSIELSDEKVGAQCGVDGCGVRLKDPENLTYHRKCHRVESDDLRCPECSEIFGHWQRLALHLWRNHRRDLELYSCPACRDFRSFTPARLEQHLLSHREDRPHLCGICGKGFKSPKHLSLHETCHKPEKKIRNKAIKGTCGICSRKFAELRLLRHHMESVHKRIRPHLCNYCGYSASSKSTLKLHIRTHTGEKPFECSHPDCGYRTADHNSLRRHKMKHSGEKPYKCPYCSYSSIQSSTYKVHLKNKHPNHADSIIYHCNWCLFKTLQEGNYLAHIAGHDKKPVKSEKTPSTTVTKVEEEEEDQETKD